MKRRSDRLRDRGRVGSVTTVGCSHSVQDAAGGARAPRRRRQVDDDRLALDSTLLVIVADGEARDAVVILAAGDDGSNVACTRSSLQKVPLRALNAAGKRRAGD